MTHKNIVHVLVMSIRHGHVREAAARLVHSVLRGAGQDFPSEIRASAIFSENLHPSGKVSPTTAHWGSPKMQHGARPHNCSPARATSAIPKLALWTVQVSHGARQVDAQALKGGAGLTLHDTCRVLALGVGNTEPHLSLWTVPRFEQRKETVD